MSERPILESWKAVAAYLGHDIKTCRRWEKELGLPVHRLEDSPKAHIFAYADEIELWKENRVLPERSRSGNSLPGHRRKIRFWLIAASTALVLIIAGLLVRPIRLAKMSPGPQTIKSVAVLPFVDLSSGKDQDHLAEGISDILINALNGVEGLRVPGRTSAFYFKGKDASPQEVGRKLRVEWILEGSVQVQENKLRVVASLLNGADGYTLWTERYDRNFSDIFAIEDEIARRVVDNLKVKIMGDRGAPIVKPGTQNIAAYNLYLNGQYSLKKGFAEGKAIEYFEKALEEDPNFAEAYAGIAKSFRSLGRMGHLRPADAFARAKAAALKALEINSHNGEALGILCDIKTIYDWDFRGAENDIRRGIQDNPGSYPLHGYYSNLLMALGRYEEALAEAKRAMSGDPLSPESLARPSNIYYFWRKYDLALEGIKKTLGMDPQNAYWYINQAMICVAMGRYEDARGANQRRREILGTSSEPEDLDEWSALVYALNGNPARAREILTNLKNYVKDKYYPYHLYAWVHAALGEKDEAFFWLEKAYQERTGQLYLLKVYPLADPLRDDPRFKDLVRRIGLEK